MIQPFHPPSEDWHTSRLPPSKRGMWSLYQPGLILIALVYMCLSVCVCELVHVRELDWIVHVLLLNYNRTWRRKLTLFQLSDVGFLASEGNLIDEANAACSGITYTLYFSTDLIILIYVKKESLFDFCFYSCRPCRSEIQACHLPIWRAPSRAHHWSIIWEWRYGFSQMGAGICLYWFHP